jgi:predicted nucleotidyltransferase
MPATNSWLIRLRNLLGDKCLSYPEIRIGVFGSCLDGNLIRDVDLLLIYREHVPIERLIKFREKLREEILFAFGLPVDLCTFSEAEAAENPFIDEEGVIMLTGLG